MGTYNANASIQGNPNSVLGTIQKTIQGSQYADSIPWAAAAPARPPSVASAIGLLARGRRDLFGVSILIVALEQQLHNA